MKCEDDGLIDDSDEESIKSLSLVSTSRRHSSDASGGSSGWESSVSECDESDRDRKHIKFQSMRAQHYFMKQALRRGKDLIETDEE